MIFICHLAHHSDSGSSLLLKGLSWTILVQIFWPSSKHEAYYLIHELSRDIFHLAVLKYFIHLSYFSLSYIHCFDFSSRLLRM